MTEAPIKVLDSREKAMVMNAHCRARTSLSLRDEGGSLNFFLKASLDGVGFVVRRFKAGEEVLDASVVYILDFGPEACFSLPCGCF